MRKPPFRAHGVWAEGVGEDSDSQCWVHLREVGDRILIDVPKYKTPLLTADAALYLSEKLGDLARRLKE